MKSAFLFPGQGSQSVGMMQGLADQKVVKDTFQEASDILGQDFWLMATEPNEALNQTSNTQPLMLTAGVATWRAWQNFSDHRPSMLAGHSLGEYTALVAAGALAFEDALPLVRFRANVMQNAVAEGVGAMAAILGLDDETVREVCEVSAQNEVLEAVNLNSPGQVVIAGHHAAVMRGMEYAKSKGAKRAIALPVSVPSHCALMKPAALELEKMMAEVNFQSPHISVVHNADVKSYTDITSIKQALVKQLYSPVRWVETIQYIHQQGIQAAAECGPGKVLAGLNKRIVDDFSCVALLSMSAFEEASNQFSQS
jgi:[acyl-carrier-protein] S-malonyltransferase